jgi:Flp pilus assembly protein TadG
MAAYYLPKAGQINTAKQRGIIMPMLAVSLVALLAVGGLALDSGHLFINKTRLQNAVDAAARSAAKVLDSNLANAALATAAGQLAFNNIINLPDNSNQALAGLVPDIQYSLTVNPFVPAAAGPFIRVAVTNFTTGFTFTRVLPGVAASVDVAASAVAGSVAGSGTGIVLYRDYTISGGDS